MQFLSTTKLTTNYFVTSIDWLYHVSNTPKNNNVLKRFEISKHHLFTTHGLQRAIAFITEDSQNLFSYKRQIRRQKIICVHSVKLVLRQFILSEKHIYILRSFSFQYLLMLEMFDQISCLRTIAFSAINICVEQMLQCHIISPQTAVVVLYVYTLFWSEA